MPEKQPPKWLIDIQQNSYLPELMISGTLIFSLQYLGSGVETTAIEIKQFLHFPGRNLFFLAYSLAMYTALVGLKWGFILHLILRAFWVSLVGLSYIYPAGIEGHKIKQDKAFTKDLTKPFTFDIMRIEKWCSGIFSLMVLYALFMVSSILICAYLFLAFNIHLWAAVAVGIIFLIYIMDFLSFRTFRKTGLSKILLPVHFISKYLLLTFLYRKIYYVYASKAGKLKLIVTFIPLLLLGALSAYPMISDVMRWPDVFEFRSYAAKLDNHEYEDRLEPGHLISRMCLSSYTVDNEIELFVVYGTNIDRMYGDQLDSISDIFSDQFNNRKNNVERLLALKEAHISQSNIVASKGQLLIDDKEITNLYWTLEDHPVTGQLGFRTTINLEEFEPGLHFFGLGDKTALKNGNPKFVFLAPFIKK